MRLFNRVGWQYGITSEPGLIKNEHGDNIFIKFGMDAKGRKYSLAMIANDLKGCYGEQVASKLAIDEVKKTWDQRISQFLEYRKPTTFIEAEIEKVFQKINSDLYHLGQEKGDKLGATLSLLFLINDQYIVVHVGDNRIYKVRKKHIELVNRYSFLINDLTNEHEELDEENDPFKQINNEIKHEKKALDHDEIAEKHCLGKSDEIIIHKLQGRYKIGDLFILSSDGFNHYMNEFNLRTMLYAMGKEKNLQKLSDVMVQLVKKMGGKESASTIIIQRAYSSMNIVHRAFKFIIGKLTKVSVKIKEASRIA